MADILHCIPDDAQAAVAQKIDFHQAGIFSRILFPLDDGNPLGGALDRHIGVDGVRGDHDPARVDGKIAGGSGDAPGHFHDLRPGGRKRQAAGFGTCFQCGHQVRVRFAGAPEIGQSLCDPSDLRIGEPVNFCGFADGHARLHENVAGHHGGMATVAGQDGVKDPVPFVPGKVHIDVRRVLAARVEEPLEIEVVFERADIGDLQAVGHQGGRPGAPAADAGALPDNVPDRQEVCGEVHLCDDAQFVFYSVDHRFGQLASVTVMGARIGRFPQAVDGIPAVGGMPGGHHDAEGGAGKGQPIGKGMGCMDCLGADGKTAGVFPGIRQPGIPGGHPIGSDAGQARVAVDGP